MQNTQLLEWDSRILGMSVAKILATTFTTPALAKQLRTLKTQGVKLVYGLTHANDAIAQQAAQACGGFLADKKLTYCLDLMRLPPLVANTSIEPYRESTANAALESIAMQISQFSRFACDPKLGADASKKLYKAWINNACKKIVAHEVLVIKKQSSILGMVVLDEKHTRGDISLIGVMPAAQRQGLGKSLVQAALHWCQTHGYLFSQVVTQKTNLKACRLYERCGFQLEKTQHVYHFWL